MGLYLFFPAALTERHISTCQSRREEKKAQVLLIMLATVPLYLGIPGSRYAGRQSRGLVYYFSLVVFLWGRVGMRSQGQVDFSFINSRAQAHCVVIATLRTIVSAGRKGLCNASSCKRAESTEVILVL